MPQPEIPRPRPGWRHWLPDFGDSQARARLAPWFRPHSSARLTVYLLVHARLKRVGRGEIPVLEPGSPQDFGAGAKIGWEAALLEFEHQAEHWETPDHGEVGHLIAQALRAAVEIARTGGLRCEHRGGATSVPDAVLQLIRNTPALAPLEPSYLRQPPSAA